MSVWRGEKLKDRNKNLVSLLLKFEFRKKFIFGRYFSRWARALAENKWLGLVPKIIVQKTTINP